MIIFAMHLTEQFWNEDGSIWGRAARIILTVWSIVKIWRYGLCTVADLKVRNEKWKSRTCKVGMWTSKMGQPVVRLITPNSQLLLQAVIFGGVAARHV
jgi:hypothetical protein